MFDVLLFVFLFLLAFLSVYLMFVSNLLALTLLTTLISLISTVLYMLLNAVDVAITEAAVGAGVSTVLSIIIIYLTSSYFFSRKDNQSTKFKTTHLNRFIYGIPFVIMFYIFIESIASMPVFGELGNPTNNILYKTYLQGSFHIFHVHNAVTMILGSYRGYDTLGETLVILLAALGVYLILLQNNPASLHTPRISTPLDILNKRFTFFVPINFLFTILPILLVFAAYVQFHGDFGPGGGFQAGILLATPYILYFLFYGSKNVEGLVTTNTLIYLIALGVLIYSLTGVVTLALGGAYLDYYVLGFSNQHSYHYGLFAIEFGVGMTVFTSMYLIINEFFVQIQFQEKYL